MIKKNWKVPVFGAALLLTITNAHAAVINGNNGGITLNGTRFIFDSGKDARSMKDVPSMKVANSSASDVWLMRFWLSPYGEKSDDSAGAQDKAAVPFVVTPPLYRLDPGKAVQLRVNPLPGSKLLPSDRESVFYLNSLAIPPKSEKGYQKAVLSGLQFAVNTRIKFFYRPAGLKDQKGNTDPAAAPEELAVCMSGKMLVVKNPTPWFVTMVNPALKGKVMMTNKDTMIAPFSELRLPVSGLHDTFSYSTVDDRGMTTKTIDRKLDKAC